MKINKREELRYGVERDLGFYKMRWIFKISKMHHSKIEIKIIKKSAYTIVNEP